MGWFNNNEKVEIKNDLDIHDKTLYIMFLFLSLLLLIFYIIRKSKKLERRIEAARRTTGTC